MNRAEEEALLKLVEALAGNIQALTDVVVLQGQALAHLGSAQEAVLNTSKLLMDEVAKLRASARMESQRTTDISARVDANSIRTNSRLDKVEGVYGSRRMA